VSTVAHCPLADSAFARKGDFFMSAVAYRQLRAEIAQEKEQRLRDYQADLARARSMAATGVRGPGVLKLLAQGDSWFDYPLPPLSHSDVVAHLKSLPALAPKILSLAHYGEAMEDMLGVEKIAELRSALADPANGRFDAILFSGGGNDLAGNQFRLWLAEAAAVGGNPAMALNGPRVEAILEIVRAGYEDLVAVRDAFDRSIPIFVHGYDFAIPSGLGVCNVGPWLKPGLDDRGWTDPATARNIVKDLLLGLDWLLKDLQTATKKFFYVRTQGTFADADWANELHPNPEGFARIAAAFVTALRAEFPGRI
jgi:hypothetical protein